MLNKIRNFVKKTYNIILSIIIVSLMVTVLTYLVNMLFTENGQDTIQKITYNEFEKLVEDNKVDSIYYNTEEEWMTITLYNDTTKDMSRKELDEYDGYTNIDKRLVQYPAYDEFRKDMLDNNINMVLDKDSTKIYQILSKVISLAFPIICIVILFNVMSRSSGNIKKEDIISTSDVRFDDIIGHEEILDDIKFITELIKNPEIGDTIGTKLPKGILLSGDPGCGKTLIAKAIAGEAGVPFLYQNASSFIDRLVGMGAKHVRDLFKLAKENAPCIVFIDEIDAIGGDRNDPRGTSENDQTIIALLQEMDGFNGRDGIFVIAATNRSDILDKALVRAGRFDRQIVVSPPRDWRVRKELFDHYLGKFSVSDDINTENLSKQIPLFTGADIAMICNEASIIAVMNNKAYIDNDCIEEAIDKKIFKGNRSKKDHYLEDKKIVAYHESGHAVMSYLLGEPIARASIQSTVSGVGGVVFNKEKDTLFQTNLDFENKIRILYAGRASEEIKFNNVTTGASNDIQHATILLTQYITKFGFDKDFGLLDLDILARDNIIDKNDITKKIRNNAKALYKDSLNLLNDNYYLVEALAQKLLEVENLSDYEIEEVFNEAKITNDEHTCLNV